MQHFSALVTEAQSAVPARMVLEAASEHFLMICELKHRFHLQK